jgi:hypothetical protein
VESIIEDKFKWLFREIPKDDLGIDAFVELLRGDRKTRGRLFAVQIKCGTSYFSESNEAGFVYRGELKHLNYWVGYALPVLLVLCDPTTELCYWAHVAPSYVTRTPAGWKIIIPRSQTLTLDHKTELEIVTQPPQPTDLISLALYRLVIEKFPGIVIAQDIETPRDFCNFDYLANMDDGFAVITYLYKPVEAFTIKDIDEVLKKRDECARSCGWAVDGPWPRVILFFVAENIPRLVLGDELITYLSEKKEISYYRLKCDFRFGIWLTELNDSNEPIEMYHRDGY